MMLLWRKENLQDTAWIQLSLNHGGIYLIPGENEPYDGKVQQRGLSVGKGLLYKK